MPKIKTEVLGSTIEINFNENERKKLTLIIDNFKERIKEFKKYFGKVSDSKIIFLAALKAEDEIKDLQNLVNIKDKKINTQINLNNELNNLKNENKLLKIKNEELEKYQILAVEKIDLIEKKILNILNNI